MTDCKNTRHATILNICTNTLVISPFNIRYPDLVFYVAPLNGWPDKMSDLITRDFTIRLFRYSIKIPVHEWIVDFIARIFSSDEHELFPTFNLLGMSGFPPSTIFTALVQFLALMALLPFIFHPPHLATRNSAVLPIFKPRSACFLIWGICRLGPDYTQWI